MRAVGFAAALVFAADGGAVSARVKASNFSPVEKEAAIKKIFGCAVKDEPVIAEHIITNQEPAGGWRKGYASIETSISKCMSRDGMDAGMLHMSTFIYRGELARAQIALGKKSTLALAIIVPRPQAKSEVIAAYNKMRTAILLSECIVARATAESAIFVDANAGSPEEAASFQRLQPALDVCPLEDRSIALSGNDLRAGLALALYTAYAPTGALAEKAK